VYSKFLLASAITGLALAALLLTGSSRYAPGTPNPALPPELVALRERGKKLFAGGQYLEAREVFLRASARAAELGLDGPSSTSLANAASCLYVSLNFRGAQADFERARLMARRAHSAYSLAVAENNLASLYLHIHEPEKALQVATEALDGPEGTADAGAHAQLLYQRADALAELDRFAEAEPLYRQSVHEIVELDQFDPAARILGKFGAELLKAGRLDDAEAVLSEGLWLVRVHQVNASANILSGLAQLKSRRGDTRSAAALFEAAIHAPPGISPVWLIRSSRGQFRLDNGDLRGALDDYREARRIALEMRADVVPADQDRVALESGLNSVMEGLVDSGNRLARQGGNGGLFRETFDTAEQDRMWSLRALVPSPNDWRSRLPDHYWEVLAQYQALERTAVTARSPEAVRDPEAVRSIDALRLEMQQIEAAAAPAAGEGREAPAGGQMEESPLTHVQNIIGDDTVMLSFLVAKSGAWVWAVDRGHVDAYPVAEPEKILSLAAAFTQAVRGGEVDVAAARRIYRDLFGAVPEKYLRHRRWMIEPDGSLNDLPFAALVPDGAGSGARTRPEFLAERAAIELVPGALLLDRGEIAADAPLLGVGDPIYNSADPRYGGGSAKPDLALPRLPNTAGELDAVSRAWGAASPTLLTGARATTGNVEAALSGGAAVVHFATHVIPAPGGYHSGMIALSLDPTGAMGLLGPKEILARPVSASLIVMNGCHSAQGETLPSSGLMGLTRAWIGAGAQAVIATGWDVPDASAQSFMTDFYRALRSSPGQGFAMALREAQVRAIERGDGGSLWAAYSLSSRIP
jgi:CHAT domain-containing protein/tetratricopeptide (TPR) repeat protein